MQKSKEMKFMEAAEERGFIILDSFKNEYGEKFVVFQLRIGYGDIHKPFFLNPAERFELSKIYQKFNRQHATNRSDNVLPHTRTKKKTAGNHANHK